MRRYLKVALFFIYRLYSKAYYRFLNFYKTEKLIIFDIDNTLADTWPSFLSDWKSEEERLLSLPVFDGMRRLVHLEVKNGNRVLFLSARNPKYHFITREWLDKNGFDKIPFILVENPKDKIYFIKNAPGILDFYDDLSFNHENGLVIFYQSLIDQVKDIGNVRYYGYEHIKRVNGNE